MSQYPSSYQGARSGENLCGRGTQDGHGGRAEEHRREMLEISEQAIRQLAPMICADIYNEALTRLVGAMQYDVETVVSVSLADFGQIFNSKQFHKVISDRIMQAMKAKLTNLEIRI